MAHAGNKEIKMFKKILKNFISMQIFIVLIAANLIAMNTTRVIRTLPDIELNESRKIANRLLIRNVTNSNLPYGRYANNASCRGSRRKPAKFPDKFNQA
jgi:hypothetical protein